MDKYDWLQLIGLAPLSPMAMAMVLEACGLSWLVEELYAHHVRADDENDR